MMTIQQAFELALQHHQAGRLAEAEGLYRQILAVQPDHAEALHHLGLVAHQAGRDDLATGWIHQSMALNPNNPAAHSNLGEVYRTMGRLDEAIASYHRALELKPDYPEACNNLGTVFAAQGRLGEAVAAFRRALELEPGYPEAHNNLGNARKGQGQMDDAISSFRRAIQLKPDYPAAHNNLGLALTERGQTEEAVAAYRRALELQPDFADACNNLGIALAWQGRFDEATAALHRALQIQPADTVVRNNLGLAFADQGRLDEAIAAYRVALQLKPHCSESHYNLGNALKEQGRVHEAVEAYREALRLMPGDIRAHSNLIYALHFHPGVDGKTIVDEQTRWDRQFGGSVKGLVKAHGNDRVPERRLRIGLVSPEFRDHVTGRYLLPLFKSRDRRSFEIVGYAGVTKPDEMTEEFRKLADHWRSTVGVPDETLAEMIREDGVDILVDLTQHLAGNRLPVFARRPAPVQVSFAGYPESTRLEAIGYRISDRRLENCGTANAECGMVETNGKERVFLIDSFWCYDPCGVETEVNALRARENGRLTFGSLNNFCKVNEPLLRLWARVLEAVPGSHLVLLSHPGSHRQRTRELLEREGVAASRVEFAEPRSRKEYLELYHRVDIALDPFPYGGHTTSLDALWMGVPVVSLAGKTSVSRAGLSILSNLGLPELVAFTEDDYVSIAARLAHDLPRLAELRATLRQRMEASVLMDAPRFARQIEAAYRAMWRQWCTEKTGQ